MNYSRSRTHGKQRARRGRRLRFLLAFNAALLLLAAGIVWFLSARHSGGGLKIFPPSSSQAASQPPSPSASVGSPSGEPSSPKPSEPGDTAAPPASGSAGGAAGDTITLAFTGDILPAGSVAQLMGKLGYDYPYREARSLLESADIAAGNLEAPITDRGTPEENKQYLFRGPAEALPALKEAGFDVLNLANNHTLDYGWVGLRDTMDALDDHGLLHMGGGADDKEAFTPVYVETKGFTVAFIGVTNVVPKIPWKADKNHPGVAEIYNPSRAIAAVKEARAKADLVVVMVHWGNELAELPLKDQTTKGHQLIDAGADLVVGSHPHVLQGFDSYKGKWIAYSLGNFVFNVTAKPRTSETGVLVAACKKGGACELKLHPMLSKNSQPAPMDPEAGKALLARLTAVSATVDVEENGHLVAKR